MVRGIGKDLQNSPLSGWREITVATDGNSRDRVKMCLHLKGIREDEEEWYRGNKQFLKFNVFVSLNQQRDESVFLYNRKLRNFQLYKNENFNVCAKFFAFERKHTWTNKT